MALRVPKHIVYRHFVNETVVLNLDSGKYHGLNKTAGRMLELLDDEGDLQQAIVAVAAEYSQPEDAVRRDLESLCSDLLERGILETDSASAAG